MIIFDTSMMRDYISAAKRASNNMEKAYGDLNKVVTHSTWTCPEKYEIDDSIQACRNELRALYGDITSYYNSVENALSEFENKESLLLKLFDKVVCSIKNWVSDIVTGICDTVQKVSSWVSSLFNHDVTQDNEIVLFPGVSSTVEENVVTEELSQEAKLEAAVSMAKLEKSSLLSGYGISDADVDRLKQESTTEEEFTKKLEELLKGKCGPIDVSRYSNAVPVETNSGIRYYYTNPYGSCPWYAVARYNETHDSIYKCSELRDGGLMYQTADNEIFDVMSTQDCDFSSLKQGFATADPDKWMNTWGAKTHSSAGHVVYIEGVVGDTVFYSDCWYEKTCSNRCLPIEEFKNEFSMIIAEK